MKAFLFLLLACLLAARAEESPGHAIIVAGLGGTEQYREIFSTAATQWQQAAEKGRLTTQVLGVADPKQETAAPLRQALEQVEKGGPAPLWLVLIGHGTADATGARFNLPGPDLKAEELAQALQPFTRPVVVVLAFSTSGAFLKSLSQAGRIVLTATRSASEESYSRLAKYLGESISDPEADLDQDGQTSLLEAWLAASRKVTGWYQGEGRLVTEHSLLDDTGDAAGTPSDWFQGTRATKKPLDAKTPVDGLRAHQLHLVPSAEEAALTPAARAERDHLEQQLNALRERKPTTAPEAYAKELEAILLKIAHIYAGH